MFLSVAQRGLRLTGCVGISYQCSADKGLSVVMILTQGVNVCVCGRVKLGRSVIFCCNRIPKAIWNP